jgi:hypothetical protein
MLTIGELFCCCILRQFLLFVEVFWSEMFVVFLDFLLSVSAKFLFLCVCVCVCVCLIQKSWTNIHTIFQQFVLCNHGWYSIYIFAVEFSPTKLGVFHNFWKGANWETILMMMMMRTKQYPLRFFFFFFNSFFGLLSLQFSVFVEKMSGNWFSGLLGHDYIFLLICHTENTSICCNMGFN